MTRKSIFLPGFLLICFAAFCTPSANAQVSQPFADCGTLVPGVEAGCVLLNADGGGAYLVGLNGFQLGDYVFVEGVVDPFCITTCQQGNGCLFNVTTFELCTPLEMFQRGDCNNDGANDLSDAIFALDGLFLGTAGPAACEDACDGNDDGSVNIADVIAILGALFGQAVPLPAPGPGCGVDPTPNDPLPCGATNCP